MSTVVFEKHTIEYIHDGSKWDIDIMATSESDAWQRLHRAVNGSYIGVCMSVPTNSKLSAKAICFFRNLFGRVGTGKG